MMTYQMLCPAKVDKVEYLLDKYKGNEREAHKHLIAKYVVSQVGDTLNLARKPNLHTKAKFKPKTRSAPRQETVEEKIRRAPWHKAKPEEVSPNVAEERPPPAGINPATIAEDVPRIQAEQRRARQAQSTRRI